MVQDSPTRAGSASDSPSPDFAWIDPATWLAPEHRAALETYAANLAEAALIAQTALALTRSDGAPTKAVALADPMHVREPFEEVVQRLVASPETLMSAQADLFARYAQVWRGGGQGEPPTAGRSDKRFTDAEWSRHPVFEFVKSSYLVSAEWLNGVVDRVEGVDPLVKRRVAFATRLMTDAFSPANFLFSNPAALREAAATRGESLLRGARAFARDIARGGGELAIKQTDLAEFKVGENVATTPGKVIFQNDLFQLIQYAPLTHSVYEIPLLIFPPWINKFYILDLQPQKSMIRWLTEQGFSVFVTSWVNPTTEHADRTLADYMIEGVYAAVQQVMRQCESSQVNAVGYCSAGTLLSCSLAHMAARGLTMIASATFFAAQQDFTDAGDLSLFVSDAWIADIKQRIDEAGGVLPSQAMADTFNMLRANDLIWSFYVNNYLMGREPAAFDLLFWNADQTRMPGALHVQYLTDFYLKNRLAKGELDLGGVELDLSKVSIPLYIQASREDHIAPMRSVYNGARLFGGRVSFTLAGSGHIAGVINHPATGKYQHWTNPELPATLDAWIAGAVEHEGSWWPHWAAWLGSRSGNRVAARDPTSGPLPVLEDAPGSYVKARSSVVEPDPPSA